MRSPLICSLMMITFMACFVGCSSTSNQSMSSMQEFSNDAGVITLAGTDLKNVTVGGKTQSDFSRGYEGLLAFAQEKRTDPLASLGAKVNKEEIDFTSISYSDDTLNVGETIQVRGVIPDETVSSDEIAIYFSPSGVVDMENGELSRGDGESVLTFDLRGVSSGIATVRMELKNCSMYHFFEVSVNSEVNRTSPVNNSYTVYVTRTGKKYHSAGCGYLRGGGEPMSADQARAKGLSPCSRCHPDW